MASFPRGLKRLAKADSLGSKTGPGLCGGGGASPAEPGVGSRHAPRHAGAGRLIFFLGKCGIWLGVDGFSLLLAQARRRVIDLRVNGRRGGFVLRRDSAAIRDQAFDGHDHCEGLDLAGNAASGHFGAQVGDFPEAGQDLFAAQVQPALFLRPRDRSESCSTSCCCTAARCSSM